MKKKSYLINFSISNKQIFEIVIKAYSKIEKFRKMFKEFEMEKIKEKKREKRNALNNYINGIHLNNDSDYEEIKKTIMLKLYYSNTQNQEKYEYYNSLIENNVKKAIGKIYPNTVKNLSINAILLKLEKISYTDYGFYPIVSLTLTFNLNTTLEDKIIGGITAQVTRITIKNLENNESFTNENILEIKERKKLKGFKIVEIES